MKLLNREPTEEMISAGDGENIGFAPRQDARDIWLAMYDKAPEIQQDPVWYHKHWGKEDDIFYTPDQDVPSGSVPLYAFPPDAQAEIAKRDERIAELEYALGQPVPLSDWEKMEQERDNIAAQNQQLRYALEHYAHGGSNYRKIAADALALTDLASPVLNRMKAEAYREMATYFENYGPRLAIDQLRKMADAIEKGGSECKS